MYQIHFHSIANIHAANVCYIYSIFFYVCVYVLMYVFVAYIWPNPTEANSGFSVSHLNDSLV